MSPTLEDFFKGKKHNCLSNRVFAIIDGKLMEQRATDYSLVSSERLRQPTFFDIANGLVKPSHLPDHSQVGMMGGGRIFRGDPGQTPNDTSVADRRLAKRFVTERAQLSVGDIARTKQTFSSGNLHVGAAVLLDWITREHAHREVDMSRAHEIQRLIAGDLNAGAFICKVLRHLSEPSTQDDPNDYDFSPAVLRQLNHMQLAELFKQARPVALSVTDITRAFKLVKAVNPEVTYVYFDEQLRWKHVDRYFDGIEVGNPALDDFLETAALVAADRGLLGKWLRPDA